MPTGIFTHAMEQYRNTLSQEQQAKVDKGVLLGVWNAARESDLRKRAALNLSLAKRMPLASGKMMVKSLGINTPTDLSDVIVAIVKRVNGEQFAEAVNKATFVADSHARAEWRKKANALRPNVEQSLAQKIINARGVMTLVK